MAGDALTDNGPILFGGKRWIEKRVPGNSPDLKGPLTVPETEALLTVLLRDHPEAFYTVVCVDAEGPLVTDGGEWLEQMSRRHRGLVRGYRTAHTSLAAA